MYVKAFAFKASMTRPECPVGPVAILFNMIDTAPAGASAAFHSQLRL